VLTSPFLDEALWVSSNEYAVAIRDAFPVTPGHTLIVPKRIVSNVFDLSEDEALACWRLLALEREKLLLELRCDGFNVGINVGEHAGQTIMHAHPPHTAVCRGPLEPSGRCASGDSWQGRLLSWGLRRRRTTL